MATYQAKRGQVIVAGTLMVAILTLSLTLTIYQMSGVKEDLRATPVRETVLGIASDLDRALTYALSNASGVYRSLWTRPEIPVEEAYQQANESGRRFLSTWKRSLLTVYSNLGVGLEYANENFGFDWDGTLGWTGASCIVDLNISAYGFTGWIADRSKAIKLRLDPDSIAPNHENNQTRLRFSVSDECAGQSRPISDLSPENLGILAHVAGPVWVWGNVLSLEYNGAGSYTLVFSPDVNQFSRSVVLNVTTPEEQIVVAASYRGREKAHIAFNSLDVNRTSAVDNLGSLTLSNVTYTLPNSTDIYPWTYGLKYVPADEYVFVNWTVGNESLAVVDDDLAELTSVNIVGSTTITAFYNRTGGPPSESPPGALLVNSVEVNGRSEGKGLVWLRQKITGSNWTLVDGPSQTIIHTVKSAGLYAVYFEPQAGYVFSNWTLTGVTSAHGNPPEGPNMRVIDVDLTGKATAFYARDVSNATVSLSSRNRIYPSDLNRGSISFDGTPYRLPWDVTVPLGTYSLEFLPSPGQEFVGWEFGGEVIVTNGLDRSTTALVQGSGSITALYVERNDKPRDKGPSWDILYVDQGYWLMPRDLWSGDDGKLPPSFSTGEDKQVALLESPSTPELSISQDLFVVVWVRPNPPHSVKDITVKLEFESNDAWYLLGTAVHEGVNMDGWYAMPLDSTEAEWPDPQTPWIIPENSTIRLWVTISFWKDPSGWGTFFLYHGVSWPTYVYLGGVPTNPPG